MESNRMSITCKIECKCQIECRMDCSCASSKQKEMPQLQRRMRCNNDTSNNKTTIATAITRTLVCKLRDCGDSIAFNRPCVAHQICDKVARRYNQINGGSANGDAFVDWHLTEDQLTTGLSLQVAGTAIFILLRVDHVQCHVTPPHYITSNL